MRTACLVAKNKTGPKPKPEGPREAMISMKCRQSYKDWVEALAKKHRITPSQIIDRALVEFAKANGFAAPPER